MDEAWFKRLQKRAGVTSFDLGEAIGRDRSVISRIIHGTQRMTLEQARILAEKLNVPLAEMVEKAGLGDKSTAQHLTPGFAESDASPWIPAPQPGPARSTRESIIAAAMGGGRPGVDVWQVKSRVLALAGYLPGDFFLLDINQAERVQPGDVVIAQIYTRTGATTVLRRFHPPVLVAASTDPEDARVFVVDGDNVVIRGKVIASWRDNS